jgi:hypothetical protein
VLHEDERNIRRVMRCVAVYMALLDLGMKDFEKIRQKLYDYYGRTIADCYNHPEYLREVLEELYGNKSNEIVKSIRKYFGKEIENESVSDFLEVLSEKESKKPDTKLAKG